MAGQREELLELTGVDLGDMEVDRNIKGAAASLAAKKRLLVVGASNADRLSAVFSELDHSITWIKTNSWRTAANTVSVLEEHVKEVVDKEQPDGVLFQMLDNLLYMCKKMDGTNFLTKKDEEGVESSISGESLSSPRRTSSTRSTGYSTGGSRRRYSRSWT